MTAAVLEAQGLSKSFGALRVTQDVSLSLRAGQRHALIGPNGAGKTTLVNLLTGALRLDAGAIRLAGQDVTGMARGARVRRGLVRTFQISQLFPGLTPLEHVLVALGERDGTARRWLRPAGRDREGIAEAMELLRALRLDGLADRPVEHLAYGRARLVELAMALALKPRVLLLDEPAAGIPSDETGLLLDTFERLPPDLAVLIIEHDMDLVFRYADTITVLVEGMVLASGAPAAIAADAAVRQAYLGDRGAR